MNKNIIMIVTGHKIIFRLSSTSQYSYLERKNFLFEYYIDSSILGVFLLMYILWASWIFFWSLYLTEIPHMKMCYS